MKLPAPQKILRVKFSLFPLLAFSLSLFFVFFILFLLTFSLFKPSQSYLSFQVRPKEILVSFQISKKNLKEWDPFFKRAGISQEYLKGFSVPLEASLSPRLAFLNNLKVELNILGSRLFFNTKIPDGKREILGNFLSSAPSSTLAYFEGDIARSTLLAIYDWSPKIWKELLEKNLGENLALFLVEEKDQLEFVVLSKKSEEEAKAIIGELPQVSQDFKKEEGYESLVGSSFRSGKIENIPVSHLSLPTPKGVSGRSSLVTTTYFANVLILTSQEETLPEVFTALRGEDTSFLGKAKKLTDGLPSFGSSMMVVLQPNEFLTKKFPSDFLTLTPQILSPVKNSDRIGGVIVVFAPNELRGAVALRE